MFSLLFFGFFVLIGCQHDIPSDGFGSMDLKFLSIGNDQVDTISLTVSGPGIDQPVSADLTIEPTRASITISGIPAGEGRVVEAKCLNQEGAVVCQERSEGILIEENKTATVAMILHLESAQILSGSLFFELSVNHKPVIERTEFSPGIARSGSVVHCQAIAHDEDGDPLTYSWSSTEGSFSEPTSPITDFSVATDGPATIKLVVGDGETEVSSVTVLKADSVVTTSIVINEFLADPPDGLEGDANGDGIRDTNDDEFVELLNNGDTTVDLSGYVLADATAPRHTFAEGSSIAPGSALVIFGGGTPTQDNAITVSTGGLSLNNTADTIILSDPSGTKIDLVSYTAEAGKDQSLTRSPEGSGNFVLHKSIAPTPFSPGLRADGTPFE